MNLLPSIHSQMLKPKRLRNWMTLHLTNKLCKMKIKLLITFLLLMNAAIAQQNNYNTKIAFPRQYFADSSTYEVGIQNLSANVIRSYINEDKPGYYNDLFRLQFAQHNYAATIQSLDSFTTLAIADKAYRNSYGFHYRVYCLAMLTQKETANNSYQTSYEKQFSALFEPLPDDGKEMVNKIYEKAHAEEEKQTFIGLTKKYISAGDSISIVDAINFIKQWNYWQLYEKTVPLAKKQIAVYVAINNANKEDKLLGLDEGAAFNPNAKTFIRNVTLVDVVKQKLVPNVTIGITGKTISTIITKGNASIPKDVLVIDGSGKFLIPGLTDAHMHFFQSGGLYTRPDGIDFRKYMPYEKEIEWSHLQMKDALKRYIMNGITTVVDVGATINLLELRDKFKGKSFAPDVYMTGPLLTTNEPDVFKNLGNNEPFSLVTSVEEGKKMVQQQLPFHPDFIKIWYILEQGIDKEKSARKYLPIIKAIIEESHKHNLKVAIHATEQITAQLSAESGCDYLVHSIDDGIINDAFVKTLKDKHVILCPTLIVSDNYGKTFGQQLDFSTYELKNANPIQIASLYDLKHLPEQTLINNYKNGVRASKSVYEKQDSICLANLTKLIKAGVMIVAGTDAGNTGTMHGTSLLKELKAMKKSSMSNWQVLQSATINAAYILNKENQTGSIAVGKIADMVLLKANPIDDIQNLQQISLVINKGFLINPDTLIKETPLTLVQRQLNAYNAHNIEAFMEPYSEDVELYEFPDKLLSKGKDAMRKDYAFLNELQDLHCEIKERIIQGNIIIDKERVTGVGSDNPVEATAIYYIEGNKIKKVYFIQ